jgi:hypothetical protein
MNQELSANTTLSHYRIVSKLGACGMCEVFLARDTKLDRKSRYRLSRAIYDRIIETSATIEPRSIELRLELRPSFTASV